MTPFYERFSKNDAAIRILPILSAPSVTAYAPDSRGAASLPGDITFGLPVFFRREKR